MTPMALRDKLLAMKYEPSMTETLLRGISRKELEDLLVEQTPGETAELSRMNFLGGLRSQGFILEGARGNQFVKVIDWCEKPVPVPAEAWAGESRAVLEWIESLYQVDKTFEATFRPLIKAGREPWPLVHESSWLDLWAYELGPNARTGYFYTGSGLDAVIVRKFNSRPRFSIFLLRLEEGREGDLADLALRVSKASVKPVTIKHILPTTIDVLKTLVRGSAGGSRQCLYDISSILENPRLYWSKQSFKALNGRMRDTEFREDPPVEDMVTVVDRWKEVHARRHRQAAIGRDYAGIRAESYGSFSFGGYRNGEPVAHQLFDTFGHRSDAVAHINEKALNYSTMPEGKSGTSDWSLFAACQRLAEGGFRFIQAGDMMQGGDRHLYEKKLKLARGETFVSPTFTIISDLSEYA